MQVEAYGYFRADINKSSRRANAQQIIAAHYDKRALRIRGCLANLKLDLRGNRPFLAANRQQPLCLVTIAFQQFQAVQPVDDVGMVLGIKPFRPMWRTGSLIHDSKPGSQKLSLNGVVGRADTNKNNNDDKKKRVDHSLHSLNTHPTDSTINNK